MVPFSPGTVAGNNVVEARASGLGAARFLVWTKAGDPSRIVVRSGDGQTGPIGDRLPESIVLRVEDQYGNGVYGYAVRFSTVTGVGEFRRGTLSTDTLGLISTDWVLGRMGSNSAKAEIDGPAATLSTTFSATGTAGSGERILVIGGTTSSSPP